MPIPLNHSQDFPILQYADYTLIIMEAKDDLLAALKDILHLFSLSIGLKVNFSKSMLVPINMEPESSLSLAQSFGCTLGSLPFTYLGLPLSLSKPKVRYLASNLQMRAKIGKNINFFYLRQADYRLLMQFFQLANFLYVHFQVP